MIRDFNLCPGCYTGKHNDHVELSDCECPLCRAIERRLKEKKA